MASPSHPPIIEQELDPLLCPFCGGQMRVIAFAEKPKVIDKIIRHLKLSFIAKRPPVLHFIQEELQMAEEERREYL